AQHSIEEGGAEDRDRGGEGNDGTPEGGRSEERAGDGAVHESLEGRQQQDAAKLGDLHELDGRHERDARVALEKQRVDEFGRDEAEGEQRREGPARGDPGVAEDRGEDGEERALRGADDEITEQGEPERKESEGAEQVDDPD